MQRIIRVAASCGLAAALLALLPLAASAHERREVADGRYELVVGFIEEPAFVGEKNGLWLQVNSLGAATTSTAEGDDHGGGAGVLGLADTLQAEVIYGEETMALPLTPAFDEPGVYESVFFPTAAGDYTFRIFGDIEGTAIDETFTSSPEGFDSVQEVEPLQFPKGEAGVDGATLGTVGDGSGGVPGGSGGLLLGALGLAGAGLLTARPTASPAVVGS